MKVIMLDNISKRFKIGSSDVNKIQKIIGKISGVEYKKKLLAINKANLDINKGESVGIIGKNGSGKSTLLRLIAGIYEPDEGKIKAEGKIVSAIGINCGYYNKLTVKEGISLYCSLYGLSKKEINSKINDIIKFADLDKSINTKLYQLSEGMKQRLISSITIHSKPDIIILDDVDMIVDKNFVKKAIEQHKKMIKKGLTVIAVSHNKEFLKNFDRIVWLENGKIKKIGGKEILNEYFGSK
jgi:ABC-type polysaccharide/polyol phosphate transport system ATPase subunit